MAPFFVKLTHSAIFFVLNICAIYLDYVKKPECSGDLSAFGGSRLSKMPFAVRGCGELHGAARGGRGISVKHIL